MATHEKEEPASKEAKHPIRPNMLMLNAKGMSSTVAKTDFSHSVLTEVKFFNSRVHQSNLEGCAFDSCDFDGSTFSSCSFRGVELINCDVDRLMINGINVGNLLRIAMGRLGEGS
jgi:uncharacterized protein YjbI with pentapeptide repeats